MVAVVNSSGIVSISYLVFGRRQEGRPSVHMLLQRPWPELAAAPLPPCKGMSRCAVIDLQQRRSYSDHENDWHALRQRLPLPMCAVAGEAFMAASTDDSGNETTSGKEDSPSRGRWLKKPVVWLGALVTAVITGLLVNLVTGAVSHAGAPGVAPNIEVDSMTAQFVPFRSGIPARPVKIDFEIRNTGNQLAIIKAVRVTVEQFAALPVCFSAGALVSTGTYHASLPKNPMPGTKVYIPTAQQVAPDAADRFDITLGLPATHLADQHIYIYRVAMELLYDNSSIPANAGKAVIALPVAPYDDYFWTKQFAAHPSIVPPVVSPPIAPVSRCLVNNSRKLHSILAMTGVRPAELTAVQSQLSTCCGWDPARR